MKIYVCVKHVPDTAANIKVVGDAGFDESVKFILNPYDEYAVEEAIRIVNKEGGEVVIVTAGKGAAANTIRSALAVGADRGILVKTGDQFLDSGYTGRILKAAIEQDGTPDLILTGKQSIDSEGMQTHYRLAAAFGMPVVTEVVSLAMEDGKAVVECEIGGGEREVSELAMPCVIGATKGLNEPRYPKLPDILKAKKKQIKQIDLSELSIAPSDKAAAVVKLEAVPERGQARMLEGGSQEMVEELVRLLKEEDKIL
jgi:electron transfer flavoprotein beta subunit